MFAWLAELITQDKSYFRTNMVVKTRDIDLNAMTQDEAGALVMSVWNPQLGEQLTLDGSMAWMRALQAGVLTLDSPVLQDLYIPYEMRTAIQEHQQILDALAVRDSARAGQALRDHVRNGLEGLVASLRAKQEAARPDAERVKKHGGPAPA